MVSWRKNDHKKLVNEEKGKLIMDQLRHPNAWFKENNQTQCRLCSRAFTSFRRKHNCKKCGEVVCGNCTLRNKSESSFTGRSSTRVCVSCILSVAQEKSMYCSMTSTDVKLVSDATSDYSCETPLRSRDDKSSSISRYSVEHSDFDYQLDLSWSYPWPKPPVVPNESQRLAVLQSFQIMDTPSEDVFDITCDLAGSAMKCSIAAISLLDRDREWFKSSIGLAQNEVPRLVSFAAHAIMSCKPTVVLDTLRDKRFVNSPLVTGTAKIRFYAAAPITTSCGHNLGTVFVFDTEAHTNCDTSILVKLATIAMKNLEERKSTLASTAKESVTPAYDVPYKKVIREPPPESKSKSSVTTETSSQDLFEVQSASSQAQFPAMEVLLMELLTQTSETQQQLASQQTATLNTIGTHSRDINKLADALARMEAKLNLLADDED